MRRTVPLAIAAALATLLALAGTASAKTAWYVPRPHHACRAGYLKKTVRVKKKRVHGRIVRKHGHVVWVRQVRCVSVAPKTTAPVTTTATPTVSYAAKIDPSFVQDPKDPLALTFSYSADASSTVNGASTDLGAAGQLPLGVLQLSSTFKPNDPQGNPGSGEGLLCSINVGGSTTGGQCGPIEFPSTGSFEITTTYIVSLTNSTTSTETIAINPYTTTTSESVSAPSCQPDPPNFSYTGTTCTYQLGASVIDQNGTALDPSHGPIAFQLISTDQGGTGALTFDPAGDATRCTIVMDDRTYPVSKWDGRYISSPDCTDPYQGTAPLIGDSNAIWTAAATFGGSAGWTGSSSSPQPLK